MIGMGAPFVSCRVHAQAADLGFTPPPLSLRVKVVKAGGSASLFVQSVPPGPVGRALEWLEPFAPIRIEFGPNHVLRADFDPLPHEWRRAFGGVDLDLLLLSPDGAAVASVVGPRAAIARFAAALERHSHRLDVRHLAPAKPTPGLLTPPQEAAIRAAVQHGYYDIPRPINLRDLAAKLGVRSGSLSERLRRAEGRIIRQYAASGAWRMDAPNDGDGPARGHAPEGTTMPEKRPLAKG
jgi:hypothetical protein